MTTSSSNEITQLLLAWEQGDQKAFESLAPLVETELRKLAHRYLRRESPGHTLQTSALVNEAYLKLINQKQVRWQNRAHFFGIAAQLMRRILLDHARSHRYAKRGGGARKVSLDVAAVVSKDRATELIALDDALNALEGFDKRKSRLVELRFFGGLSAEETAEVMGISLRTVEREWQKAKAWLYRAISQGEADEA